MIKPLSYYISEQTGWSLGTALVVGGFNQESPDSCVTIQDSGGVADMDRMDSVEYRFSFLARGYGYSISRALAYVVFDLFRFRGALTLPTAPTGETWDDWLINSCGLLAVPQHLGLDEKGRDLWSVNLLVYGQQI